MRRLLMSNYMINNMELRSAQLVVKNQIDIFVNKMWEQSNRIIWTNMVMPTELFYASSLIPVNSELVAGWISTLKLAKRYIAIAHTKGYNQNLCSYHKAVIGAMECGDIPPPLIAVYSSHICDGGRGMIKYFKKRFNTKVLLIDIPYNRTNENISYVRYQLVKAKDMIEQFNRESIEEEKLREAVSLSNRARYYLQKANDLRKKDTLFHGNLAIRNLFGSTFLFGSELGLHVTHKYYSQLKEMKKNNSSLNDIPKKHYRILWIHFAPLYSGDIMKYFEQELNCIIAFDITGYIYWDELSEKDPLSSLSNKIMSHFYLGDVNKRMELYKRIIKEYNIDGIVMLMHQGCRAIPGSSWEIRQIVKQMKLPFLELSGDCIDPESFSSEQMKLRMEAFSESLEMKKHVHGD